MGGHFLTKVFPKVKKEFHFEGEMMSRKNEKKMTMKSEADLCRKHGRNSIKFNDARQRMHHLSPLIPFEEEVRLLLCR
jgi:hypothetical protein